MKTFLDTHPAFNTTVPQQLMSDAHHALIYTPPYETWLQPIELIWAQAKQKVASEAWTGRTWQETEAATYSALSSVLPERCASVVRHVEDDIDRWLVSAAAGSLGRFGSFAGLKAASQQEIDRCHDVVVEEREEDMEEPGEEERKEEE